MTRRCGIASRPRASGREVIYEAPAPAKLEGAGLSVTDDGRIAAPGEEPTEALTSSAMVWWLPSLAGDVAPHEREPTPAFHPPRTFGGSACRGPAITSEFDLL
jgi:hypothetical protein